MRLNRFLASAGLGSRRGVEALILEGRVRINGKVVTDLATLVSPRDAVKVGSRLVQVERPLTAVLHKPRGYICSADDEMSRKTIFDLLPRDWPRVHHVGRLDKESEGLLVVTTDGDLTHFLTHPSHEVEKEYEVILDKPFDLAAHRDKLLRGFRIMHGFAKCERVDLLRPMHLRLVLRQGLKRQIRLMLYELGYEVERLIRVRFGTITIDTVPVGKWRLLSSKEIAALRTAPPAPAPGKKRTEAKIALASKRPAKPIARRPQ